MFTYALGDGVELGMLEPWHAEQFLGALDRSRQHLQSWIPAANSVFTLEDTRRYLQGWADGHAADSMHLFGIWLNSDLVGCVQLFDFDSATAMCEMGVWIAKEAEGRGIVTRACRCVLDWAIRVRGIIRVQWTNSPTNVRSSAVAARLGLTLEGIHRSSGVQRNYALGIVVPGLRWDEEVWSMIAQDWPTPDERVG